MSVKIVAAMSMVVRPGIDAVYFGGAIGADTLALVCANRLVGSCRTKLIVVVPDTVDKQPSQASRFYKIAHEVIELKNPITGEDGFASYRKRNQYMVDMSTDVVAFFNGDPRTGTGQTVHYAKQMGKRVLETSGSDIV